MAAPGVEPEAPRSAAKAALNETFDKGVIPPNWLVQGQQWQVTADPDPAKSGNQVLAVSALDSHVAVLTIADHALGDGTLRFRMRYQTAFPTIMSPGKNDGVHFPHWRLNFMPQNEGKGVVFIDDVVWASLLPSPRARTKKSGARRAATAGALDAMGDHAPGTAYARRLQDGEQIMPAEKCDTAFQQRPELPR